MSLTTAKPTDKPQVPTREECVEDFVKLQALRKNPINRRIYREFGRYKESDWSRYFQRFTDFQEEAEKLAIQRGVTDSPMTKEGCIADLQRVAQEHPDKEITRNLYRRYGHVEERNWIGYFETFQNFRNAAGIEEKVTKKTAAEEVAEELIFKQNYTYNEATDTYITFLKNFGTNIVLSGDRHRALKQRYSDMIDKASTINEICRDFGMPRAYFVAYKTAHGWTHDQDPFTKEEHESRNPEDMVQELEQLSRFTVQKEFQKRKWLGIQTKAKKWDEFEQSVLDPLVDALQNHVLTPSPKLEIRKANQPYALVIAPLDLHYGKMGWVDETGEAYSREEARNLVLHHSQALLDRVAPFGRPEKIIVASGSDWFHIDNPDSKTTGGTPQDCDGSYAQILTEGCELAQEHLDLLRQMAPIEFLTAPGNHDRYSALTMNLYLRAIYKGAKDVTMLSSPLPRQYTSYGNSLLGFGHGDSVKVGDLHGVMTQEAEELWKHSKNRYYFTGHFHHKLIEEVHGITHIQLQSLSGADRWHKQKGYITSSRALQGFIVSKDSGIIAELISPVNHGKGLRGVKVKNA